MLDEYLRWVRSGMENASAITVDFLSALFTILAKVQLIFQ